MPGPAPRLSIIIRCRNQAKTLERVLKVLSLQECDFAWETIVVDNESTDATRQIALDFGATVVDIPQNEYTHGRALNRGMTAARGELALMLSAHCLPVGRHFLASAVEPFSEPDMAAAMCIKSDVQEFIAGWNEPEDLYWPPDKQPKTDAEKFAGVRKLMNSGLVIRRGVWQEIPYDETLESSEDKHWAMQVLGKGYKIRRCSEAVYVYLLHRDGATLSTRSIRSALAAYRITGQPPLPFAQYVRRVLRAFLMAWRLGWKHLRHELVVSRGLYLIPRKAKQAPQMGSRAENEEHR